LEDFWAKGQKVGKPDMAVTFELLALTPDNFLSFK
jgi:hypothetical protein